MHSMNPSFSSSFKRFDRTLGVRPGTDSRSLLNRSIPLNLMSRSMSIVHFFPKTPRVLLIGHSTNSILGRNNSLEGSTFSWATTTTILLYSIVVTMSKVQSAKEVETGTHVQLFVYRVPKKIMTPWFSSRNNSRRSSGSMAYYVPNSSSSVVLRPSKVSRASIKLSQPTKTKRRFGWNWRRTETRNTGMKWSQGLPRMPAPVPFSGRL